MRFHEIDLFFKASEDNPNECWTLVSLPQYAYDGNKSWHKQIFISFEEPGSVYYLSGPFEM